MTRKALRQSVLFVACVAAWLCVSQVMARGLLITNQPIHADALIVLSGAPVYAERLRHAAAIYKRDHPKIVILSDDGTHGPWSRVLQRRPRMIEIGKEQLAAAGVPENSIVELAGVVHSTFEEAGAVSILLRERPIDRLAIVTSPYHARRALWAFRRAPGMRNVTIAVDPAPLGDLSPNPGTWWLTRRGWGSVAGEYVKFVYYRLAY